MSADGKIALSNRKQLRISCDEDFIRMYKLRNECDAILVGIGAVLTDDPKLTVNEKYVKNPKQPLRVILDSKCRISQNALVMNNTTNTLIITTKGYEKQFNMKHVEVVGVEADSTGQVDLNNLLNLLYQKGLKKLLVEGGGTVIWNFLKNQLVDDLYIYIGSFIIGGKDTPTLADGSGIKNVNELIFLDIVCVNRLGNGLLIHYKPCKF
jgi:2,5-diamino-6-(ribosylamino)-4(3H)-pyrimidinone 5'-phosphate reductase